MGIIGKSTLWVHHDNFFDQEKKDIKLAVARIFKIQWKLDP